MQSYLSVKNRHIHPKPCNMWYILKPHIFRTVFELLHGIKLNMLFLQFNKTKEYLKTLQKIHKILQNNMHLYF